MPRKRRYLSLDGEEFQVFENEVSKFQEEIEALVKDSKCSYLDAIQTYCEKKRIDIGSVSSLISPVLKAKIHEEAIELNLLKQNDKELSIFDF